VEITVVPKQVRASSAGEALDVDVDLVNTTERSLKTVVSFEVMDDLGNPVASKVVGAVADIPGKFAATSGAAGVPQAAADGYYFAKATVAWKGTDTDGTASDNTAGAGALLADAKFRDIPAVGAAGNPTREPAFLNVSNIRLSGDRALNDPICSSPTRSQYCR